MINSKQKVFSRALRKSVIFFLKTFFKRMEDTFYFLPFGDFHHNIVDKLNPTLSDYNPKKYITNILIPRGHGKTKLILGFILWSIFVFKREYVILISKSDGKSKQNLRDLKRMLKSPLLRKIFKIEKGDVDGKTELEFSFQSGKKRSHVRIETKGVGSQVFGSSEGRARPDFILLDDIMSLNLKKNKELLDDLMDWFSVEIIPALSKKDHRGRRGQIVSVATPVDGDDFVSRIAKFKACRTIKYAIMDDDGHSLYPELNSDKDVADMLADYISRGALDSWYTQQMMNPKKAKGLKFSKERLVEIKDKEIQKILYKGAKVKIIIDLAYSQKNWADYTGISVCAYQEKSQVIVLETLRDKYSPDELFDVLYDLFEKYRTNFDGIYVETKQVAWIKGFFRERSTSLGKPLDILGISDRGLDKNIRIGMLIPYFNTGFMKFAEGKNDILFTEMFTWSGGDKKKGYDTLDSLAHHVFFLIPSEELEVKEDIVEIAIDMLAGDHQKLMIEKIEGERNADCDDIYDGY